jgi:NAD(P)H-dependent FMN reductase
LAILGSTRRNSSNEIILKEIQNLFQDKVQITLYSKIDELPHFNPDIESEGVPPLVNELRELIKHSDGIIICTPEYVFSLPGTLKNALEWTVSTTVFSDKPTALIVASALGEKTFESLQLIMKTLGALVSDDSKVLIQGARSKINKDGSGVDLTVSKELQNVVESLLQTIDSSKTLL